MRRGSGRKLVAGKGKAGRKEPMKNGKAKKGLEKGKDHFEEEGNDHFSDEELSDQSFGSSVEDLQDEETADEKRLRLAKQVIGEAKMLRKREAIMDEDNQDEDETITGMLQNNIVLSIYPAQ